MKKIYFTLTSLPFMAFIFLTLGFSMAIATFVESSYGTPAARSLIYRTWWFELLWALFALNLLNNFFRFKLYSKEKLTMGIFHVSFLIMLLGAVITRYIGYEGLMHIREGKSAESIISTDDYFSASFNGEVKEKRVIFSEITPKQFSAKFNDNGASFKVKAVGYIENAVRQPIPSENGEPVIDFVFSVPGVKGMQSYNIRRGDGVNFPGFSVTFGAGEKATIRFFSEGSQLSMVSEVVLEEMAMATQDKVKFNAGDTIPIKKMFLYGYGDIRFLVRNFYENATFTAVKSQQGETGENAIIVKISDGVKEKTVPVFGHPSVVGDTLKVPLSEGNLKLAYGAKRIKVPLSLFLKDFQMEKYPGSNSPSSYASEVVLNDESEGLSKNIRIFMNNTLTYKGFKFFQSSYDQDEKGTVLSVNHDFWGTWITYFGYLLLTLGIILSLLNKKSYFHVLVKRLKTTQIAKVVVGLVLLMSALSVSAQSGSAGTAIPTVNKAIVEEFSKVWVQGPDGRIEPMSTLASEVVRKVSRKSKLYGKQPEEVMLSVMAWPEIWQELPIIKVSNKQLATDLGIAGKYATIKQLFDEQGAYKLMDRVMAAHNKTPAFRNKIEKEVIYVDERVNIFFMLMRGGLLAMFPTGNYEDPWLTPGSTTLGMPAGDSIFIKNGTQLMVESILGQKNVEALQVVNAIGKYQQKFGEGILPSESKKGIEILYNKVNIFKRIFPYYLLFGFLLLFVLFINIFRQKLMPVWLKGGFLAVIILAFIGHTIGLVARWYISGHAPWSNGFESVVYVSWAAMLAGLIFGRKYFMVIGTAAVLSGIGLFVAHLSWMNPEVTNLVPVLKSYWLTIHVAIITASYGFIGLSAFLGILVLILISLRTKANSDKVGRFITQLTTINEMSAMVGLYFLTIGTFLGAIWANESWGRYWGWDPKETWALITIVLYSFIAHMRLIPSLKGVYNYNLASVIGFASVLMTYFGVNYYLSGLHSYGKGVADGIHWAVPVSFGVLAVLIIVAWIRDSNFQKTVEEAGG